MNKEKAKKIFKIALLLYLASFLIINWNAVSWIFNYRTVSVLVSDFFNPYPSIEASHMSGYFHPNIKTENISTNSENLLAENINWVYTDKLNELEIPKLSISAPVVFSTTTNIGQITKDLDSGVVYYPGSVMPGETGKIVVLGHSAPPGWPKIKYDWVFSDIDKLSSGDLILISLNNKQYTYTVKEKNIIKKGEDIPTNNLINSNSILTLVSCWPPGKDYQRIAVSAELKK
jgi:LPXTG-site transpeptidase (sortase) family protein